MRKCTLRAHRYDELGVCTRCGTQQLTANARNVFARLDYLRWWDHEMERTWQAIGVEMVRPSARSLVALLLDEDVDWRELKILDRDEEQRIIAVAMIDHKLRHPKARGERPYLFGPGQVSGHADLLCRFCRRVIVPMAKMGRDHWSSEVKEHVIPCAITSLATAGSAAPIAPKPRPQ